MSIRDPLLLRFWPKTLLGAAILVLSGVVACGRQAPNAPSVTAAQSGRARAQLAAALQGAFFPLEIGNRWLAVSDAYYRVEPLAGPPYDEIRYHTEYVREMIGTETLFGRPYVVMEEVWTSRDPFTGDPRTGTDWIRYRQDGSGLYEADVATTTPPSMHTGAGTAARGSPSTTSGAALLPAVLAGSVPQDQLPAFRAAWEKVYTRVESIRSALHRSVSTSGPSGPPGGLLPGEITRLRYPARPGTSWEIRPDPLFTSEVEAIESLALPAGRFPACRIRVGNEALGPRDIAHLWMGRSGQLAVRFHSEADAVDGEGNVIGRVQYDYNEVVQEISLVRP